MAGVTVVEEENFAETIEEQKSLEWMINFDGAHLIFPTSFGYFDPHVLTVGSKYPDVRFEHAVGLWSEGMPSNVGSYFGCAGMVQTMMDGGTIGNFMRGGLADGFIKMSPLRPAVSDAARAQFEATNAEIMAGGFAAIKGPLNDNQGKLIAAEGNSIVETGIELESMGYLVEGVVGSTSWVVSAGAEKTDQSAPIGAMPVWSGGVRALVARRAEALVLHLAALLVGFAVLAGTGQVSW